MKTNDNIPTDKKFCDMLIHNRNKQSDKHLVRNKEKYLHKIWRCYFQIMDSL